MLIAVTFSSVVALFKFEWTVNNYDVQMVKTEFGCASIDPLQGH